jgi:glutamate carboxypeptidase
MPVLLAALRARRKEMVRLLARLACCESPSDDKEAVDRLGHIVAAEWRRRKARVVLLRQRHCGDHLRVIWPPVARSTGQLLVLGHLDTVYPRGTLRTMPFRVAGGRAFGPGVLDMKGGLVIALFAVDALAQAGWTPHRRVVFLWTSDEEIGSASSRALIEREARRSAAVLVLEPANGPDGGLKTQRKGVGRTEITITGRAAHAGLAPEKGINALQEMALQIARIARISQPRRGITVIPTVAQAGSRTNVIPAAAHLELDLRAGRAADMRKVERMLLGLRPILPGARLRVDGGFSRPPLERGASASLFREALQLAKAMGIALEEASVGGGSDGNFTAAMGVPTLDGLGAVGNGAHSAREHVAVRALPERAALLSGLLATL